MVERFGYVFNMRLIRMRATVSDPHRQPPGRSRDGCTNRHHRASFTTIPSGCEWFRIHRHQQWLHPVTSGSTSGVPGYTQTSVQPCRYG